VADGRLVANVAKQSFDVGADSDGADGGVWLLHRQIARASEALLAFGRIPTVEIEASRDQ